MEGGVTFTLGGRFIYGERRGKLFGKSTGSRGEEKLGCPRQTAFESFTPVPFCQSKVLLLLNVRKEGKELRARALSYSRTHLVLMYILYAKAINGKKKHNRGEEEVMGLF